MPSLGIGQLNSCPQKVLPSCVLLNKNVDCRANTLLLEDCWNIDVPFSSILFQVYMQLELKKKKPRGGVEEEAASPSSSTCWVYILYLLPMIDLGHGFLSLWCASDFYGKIVDGGNLILQIFLVTKNGLLGSKAYTVSKAQRKCF
ncbi:hypothetical protein Tco_1248962 [Tanacetum coccineum]